MGAFEEISPVHYVSSSPPDVDDGPLLLFVLNVVKARSVCGDVVVDELAFAQLLAEIWLVECTSLSRTFETQYDDLPLVLSEMPGESDLLLVVFGRASAHSDLNFN